MDEGQEVCGRAINGTSRGERLNMEGEFCVLATSQRANGGFQVQLSNSGTVQQQRKWAEVS